MQLSDYVHFTQITAELSNGISCVTGSFPCEVKAEHGKWKAYNAGRSGDNFKSR